jgi:hypothetical protein
MSTAHRYPTLVVGWQNTVRQGPSYDIMKGAPIETYGTWGDILTSVLLSMTS